MEHPSLTPQEHRDAFSVMTTLHEAYLTPMDVQVSPAVEVQWALWWGQQTWAQRWWWRIKRVWFHLQGY